VTIASGDVHRITQVNGLRVITEHVPGVRSVALGVWIGVGSRHEDDDSRGYAHFLEHLLFKGGDTYNAEAISRYFDGIGSDANAATTRDYTVVHARVLDRHVGDSLEIFGEMVLAPSLDADDIEAERHVILEEIAMYEDSPSDVVHELADEMVFADHPLGLPIVGTNESIGAATPESLARAHARWYAPQNIIVSAAGAIDHDAFVSLVRQRFIGNRALHDESPLDLTSPGRFEPRLVSRAKDTEQTHIILAGRGIPRHDNRRYAASLLDTILGNAPSSRLFLEVRERRGLAYSVYSFMSSHADTGQFGVYVGVRPDNVARVLDVLHSELTRISCEAPSADELARAQGQLEGRMLLSLESTTVRGNRLGGAMVMDIELEALEETVRRIRDVTPEDILQLASEICVPERLGVAAVAHDVDAVMQLAKQAGFPAALEANQGSMT
jgi:predicted Zn-dependent peptidase